MSRTRRKTGGGPGPFTESLLALLVISIYLIGSGCASSRGNGAADTEELLGQEVEEGRIIEGTINDSREGEGNPGYRVQVVASTIREEADGIANVVKGLFPVPVYVEYYEPYYKVRVGDFRTENEAEGYRKKLADYGFESAWIVETEISTE